MNSIFFCCILSFLVSYFGIKYFIIFLKKHKKFQPIRIDGPQSHMVAKAKTPTMGGVILTTSILLNIFIFCNLHLPQIQIMVVLMLIFAITGLVDDLIKVFFNNVNGFAGSKKLIIQLLTTSICVLYLISSNMDYLYYQIHLPFFDYDINIFMLIASFYVIIICGSANATNLTDGLDGLLTMPIIFVSISFMIIIFAMLNGYYFSKIIISEELLLNILLVLCAIIVSFGCFLLFYNRNPARIFMGDVGSLMIGALLCYIAILLKVEILYGVMALLFIVEIMSSVLQVATYRLSHGKRKLFKMAPFHHHLEQCGWGERKIVRSMWLFSFCCCVIALFMFFVG